jgi:hypothetical protein
MLCYNYSWSLPLHSLHLFQAGVQEWRRSSHFLVPTKTFRFRDLSSVLVLAPSQTLFQIFQYAGTCILNSRRKGTSSYIMRFDHKEIILKYTPERILTSQAQPRYRATLFSSQSSLTRFFPISTLF